jgi:DNA (cytosine-5)-methyltransferase 1
MILFKLGETLKRLRQKKGIALKGLAKILKVDPAYLSRIESGKVPPSEQLLKGLCRRLGANFDELALFTGRWPKDIHHILSDDPKKFLSTVRSIRVNGAHPVFRESSPSYGSDGRRLYKVVDLFAGAGGFTLGFTKTGRFESVFANDFNRWAVETYNYNFGDHCTGGDINRFLTDHSSKLPSADVVIGGPPCQGFSLLNKKREGDPRKELWRAYMDVVRRVNPSVFVMENVPELLASLEFVEIKKMAQDMGYSLVYSILNAADYGVPQRRRRAIVIASKVGAPRLPDPTHFDPIKGGSLFKNGLLPWETVRRAIGDLPPPEGTEARVGEVNPPMDLHFGRNPIPSSIQRYKCVPEGGNRVDLLKRRPDLTPACWKRKKSGGTDLFGRLWWDKPAFTIRTEFFKPEKGRYLHPAQHRPITQREAARLQSFPDDFIFQGTKVEIARQIGNAVPPLLAQRIAETVIALLDGAAVHRSSDSILTTA